MSGAASSQAPLKVRTILFCAIRMVPARVAAMAQLVPQPQMDRFTQGPTPNFGTSPVTAAHRIVLQTAVHKIQLSLTGSLEAAERRDVCDDLARSQADSGSFMKPGPTSKPNAVDAIMIQAWQLRLT